MAGYAYCFVVECYCAEFCFQLCVSIDAMKVMICVGI